ncbi:MAG: DUF4190 domain-containing protein [Candidatus Omnitrophota bacterium]|jgi:flagellar biogenesis protein FliO|nr:MAG: DUF4190 domain-containing protein [Candidatus Omnitrophota bacterium]
MDGEKKLTSEFAIASLVLGIVSFFTLMGLEKAILAIVFGILGFRRISRNAAFKGKMLVAIGTVLAVIYIILAVFYLIKYFPQIQQQLMQQPK